MIRNLDREFDLQKIGRINRYASDRAPMQQAGRSNLFNKHQTRRFSKIPTMNYRNHITIEPNKRGGKPCVRGLRIISYANSCLLDM